MCSDVFDSWARDWDKKYYLFRQYKCPGPGLRRLWLSALSSGFLKCAFGARGIWNCFRTRVIPSHFCQRPAYSLDQGFMRLRYRDCVNSLICSDLNCLYRQRLAKAISLGPNHPGGGPGCRHKFGNSLLMKTLELDELIWEGL